MNHKQKAGAITHLYTETVSSVVRDLDKYVTNIFDEVLTNTLKEALYIPEECQHDIGCTLVNHNSSRVFSVVYRNYL